MAVTLALPRRPILSLSLRFGKQFIESFLGMIPFLNLHFHNHQHDVARIFHSLQKPSDTLRRVCSQAKELRDVTLSKAVPVVSKVLDKLVYATKSLFDSHNYQEAISFGRLPDRPLVIPNTTAKKTSRSRSSRSTPKKPKKQRKSDHNQDDGKNNSQSSGGEEEEEEEDHNTDNTESGNDSDSSNE